MFLDLIQDGSRPDSAIKLAEEIEGAIRCGALASGAGLPPVRQAAKDLHLSPGTVASAYRLLQQRGLVVTDGRRGTRVSMRRQQPMWLDPELPRDVTDLYNAEPDLSLLPDLGRFASSDTFTPRPYADAGDDPGLVEIAANTYRANGVDAAHVLVTAGAIAVVSAALEEYLRPGDGVAMEDPGYCGHFDLLALHNLKPISVSMDEQGMQPEALHAALSSGARAVICSPRFQSPLGAAITSTRAEELQAVLRDFPDVLVIEDDYAFLIADAPYHGAADSRRDRWVVAYSLNKSIAPDLRIGFAAGDRETIDRIRLRQSLAEGWVSVFLQRLTARALQDESTRQRLRVAADTYASRRAVLRQALDERGIRSFGESGLNVWIPVQEETTTVQKLRARGWAVRAGERFRIESDPAIRVSTSRLEEADAIRFADDLATVLGAAGPARHRP